MPIAADYRQLLGQLAGLVDLPSVREVYFPSLIDDPDRHAEFGVIVLDDGSVGLTYLYLPETRRQAAYHYLDSLPGTDPLIPAAEFGGKSDWKSAVALGVINAVGQWVFRQAGLPLDFEIDSMGELDLQTHDKLGMVGYFPPLVERVRSMGIPLTVIEKKSERHQSERDFDVSADPGRLANCNKVICTSTVVLNNTVDEILENCVGAEHIAVIGPTAGFLPDPLFARGVHSFGGTYIPDAELFLQRCRADQRWGTAARKYCIRRDSYPGFAALLEKLGRDR